MFSQERRTLDPRDLLSKDTEPLLYRDDGYASNAQVALFAIGPISMIVLWSMLISTLRLMLTGASFFCGTVFFAVPYTFFVMYRHRHQTYSVDIHRIYALTFLGASVLFVPLVFLDKQFALGVGGPLAIIGCWSAMHSRVSRNDMRQVEFAEKEVVYVAANDCVIIKGDDDLGTAFLFDIDEDWVLVLMLDEEEIPERFPTNSFELTFLVPGRELLNIQMTGDTLLPSALLPAQVYRQLKNLDYLSKIPGSLEGIASRLSAQVQIPEYRSEDA